MQSSFFLLGARWGYILFFFLVVTHFTWAGLFVDFTSLWEIGVFLFFVFCFGEYIYLGIVGLSSYTYTAAWSVGQGWVWGTGYGGSVAGWLGGLLAS